MNKSNTTSVVAAYVLVIFNVFALVVCLLTFSLGLWIIISPNSLYTIAQYAGNSTIKVLFRPEILVLQFGLCLVFVSIFVFCLSFMGTYGAISKSQFLLFMYSMLVFLLLLLECSLFYYFSSRLIEKGLAEEHIEWAHTLRLIFSCCDKNITHEMIDSDKVPWSCCGVDGYNNSCNVAGLYKKDCKSAMSAWLYKHQTAIHASIAVLHVILASCSLLRRSRIRVPPSHS